MTKEELCSIIRGLPGDTLILVHNRYRGNASVITRIRIDEYSETPNDVRDTVELKIAESDAPRYVVTLS